MGHATGMAGAVGPQPGELVPDFFGRAADGRTVYRREYRGRRHLVLCFVAALADDARRALHAALAARHPAMRAAGAEAVVFVCDGASAEAAPCPYPVLGDAGGRMHERYGAATTPLLIAADRYGEVVLRRGLDDIPAALDEALAAVEWMQTRCSL